MYGFGLGRPDHISVIELEKVELSISLMSIKDRMDLGQHSTSLIVHLDLRDCRQAVHGSNAGHASTDDTSGATAMGATSSIMALKASWR